MTSRKIVYFLLVLTIGVVIGIAVSEWMRSSYALTPAARPLSVPASATWSGGEDGGNWFDCARQADASYRCAVYADVTGEKISDGLYGFVPEDTAGQLNPLLRRSDTEIVLRGARLVRVP